MGNIFDLASHPDPESFPDAKFAAEGDLPITQCEETQSLEMGCTSVGGSAILTKAGAWTGYDLTGKICTIQGVPINNGDYTILSNTDNTLTLHTHLGQTSDLNVATCHDTGQAYLTRNVPSLIRFIENEGYAYTIKGGLLYTNCPNVPLQNACSNLWDPLP